MKKKSVSKKDKTFAYATCLYIWPYPTLFFMYYFYLMIIAAHVHLQNKWVRHGKQAAWLSHVPGKTSLSFSEGVGDLDLVYKWGIRP